MAINAFTVVSEFRFDVANAVVGSEKLQQAVDGVAESAEKAMYSIQSLGMGLVAQLSGAGGGIIGLLYNAISASDKFTDSAISFTTIIDSNMGHLSGNIQTLNDKMAVSKQIMGDIAKDAAKFGLPAQALLGMTKSLSAELAPKGLAGTNFEGARTLARNFLKSAPNLNVDPQLAQGQLLRSIEGSASMGDTLFKRLVNEAPEAFADALGKSLKGADAAKKFNTLGMEKRFEILNAAMAKFASNSTLLDMRANTLSGTIQRITDLFKGFNSILKPLGDVIIPPLVKMMNMAIDWLDTKGRRVIELMAKFIKPLIEEPEKLIKTLMDLSKVGETLKRGLAITGTITMLAALKEHLHDLSKIKFLGIGKLFGGLGSVFSFIERIPVLGNVFKSLLGMFKTGPITGFVSAIKVIGLTALRAAGLLGVLLIPLQGFVQAVNRAKIEFFEWIANNLDSLVEYGLLFASTLRQLFIPIQDLISGFEEIFFLIIGGTSSLDFFKSAFEGFVKILIMFKDIVGVIWSGLRAIIAAFTTFIVSLVDNMFQIMKNAFIPGRGLMDGVNNPFSDAGEFFMDEFTKSFDRFLTPTSRNGEEDHKVENHNHQYDVKMTNNFKEVLQPDRIAYTITEQLKKASTFATQSKNQAGSLAAKQSGAL
jgi:hypothetical protein